MEVTAPWAGGGAGLGKPDLPQEFLPLECRRAGPERFLFVNPCLKIPPGICSGGGWARQENPGRDSLHPGAWKSRGRGLGQGKKWGKKPPLRIFPPFFSRRFLPALFLWRRGPSSGHGKGLVDSRDLFPLGHGHGASPGIPSHRECAEAVAGAGGKGGGVGMGMGMGTGKAGSCHALLQAGKGKSGIEAAESTWKLNPPGI